MNTMIPMYVYTSNFVADRVEAVKDHYKKSDRGAGLVEYAGLIVLAAIILAIIYGVINSSGLKDKLTTAVSGIFSGHGAGK